MSFRRRAGGGRRDAVEPVIIEALEAHGAQTWQLSGTGCPDLLALYRGHFYVFEVKSGKGTTTGNQRDLKWPIVRTVEEALAIVSRMNRHEKKKGHRAKKGVA